MTPDVKGGKGGKGGGPGGGGGSSGTGVGGTGTGSCARLVGENAAARARTAVKRRRFIAFLPEAESIGGNMRSDSVLAQLWPRAGKKQAGRLRGCAIRRCTRWYNRRRSTQITSVE